MEELLTLVREKDKRWFSAKGRHKKSTMKAYKHIYDAQDRMIEAFDKKREKAEKSSGKKSVTANSAPHEPKP
jgi:hypothetical protein